MFSHTETNPIQPNECFVLAVFNKSGHYSLHGLWVDYSRGGYPAYCRQVTFDPQTIAPLRPQLDKDWYICGDTLHAHEWEKHGACTSYTEFEYFQQALNCFELLMSTHANWLPQYPTESGTILVPLQKLPTGYGPVAPRRVTEDHIRRARLTHDHLTSQPDYPTRAAQGMGIAQLPKRHFLPGYQTPLTLTDRFNVNLSSGTSTLSQPPPHRNRIT